MKKKILALLMASAFAASAFGMVACGGNGDSNDGVITGNTDPSTIVSDKVADEAAWKAAFSYDGITNYSAKSVSVSKRDGETLSTMNSTLSFNVDKYSIVSEGASAVYDYETGGYLKEDGKYVMEDRMSKSCAATIDGKNYFYEYYTKEEKWYREETERDIMKGTGLPFEELDDALNGYSKFTYSDGAYTATFEEEDEYGSETNNYTIKIKNGRIVYLYCVNTYQMSTGEDEESVQTSVHEQSILVYDVNNTTVTLPTDYVDLDETEEE